MTIQWSVLLWTIINFVVLMVLLNKILFQPVLKVMDERNEKIQALKDREEAEKERLAAMEREERIRLAEEGRLQQESFVRAIELEKEHIQSKENDAREKQRLYIEAYQEKLADLREEIEKSLDANKDMVSKKVAEQLEKA